MCRAARYLQDAACFEQTTLRPKKDLRAEHKQTEQQSRENRKERREPQPRILDIKADRYVPWHARPNQEELENRQRRIQRIHGSVSEAARSQGPLPLMQTLMVVILPV